MSHRADIESAFAAYQEKDFATAQHICNALLEDDDAQYKVHQLLALCARGQGDLTAAILHIETALNIAPEDAECLNTYGNLLSLSGRELDAVDSYRKSLKTAPNYVNAIQNLGELYLKRQDPMEALSVFRQGLSFHNNNPGLLRGYLYALKEGNQIEEALDVFSQINLTPDLALTAGHILSNAERFEQAEGVLKMALQHPPSAGQAFSDIIQLNWVRAGKSAAQAVIEATLKQAPQLGLVAFDSYMNMEDAASARSCVEAFETEFGHSPAVDVARAKLAIASIDGPAAFQLAKNALKAHPGHLFIMSTYVKAALMSGQAEQALKAAKAAQSRDPDSQYWIAIEATALRCLGRPYTHLYDYEKYVRVYDLDSPPNYEDMDAFSAALKAELLETHTTKAPPLGQSPRHGTQSTMDLRFVAKHAIQDFFSVLERPIKEYMTIMGSADGHPLTQRNTGDYRLSGAWSVCLQKGGHHVNHIHPRGWISSAYYADVPPGTEKDPDKAGWITFGEPPFPVEGIGPELMLAPRIGRLVLFPSYMWHGTIPLKEDTPRMTLPFDVVPA